MAVKIYNLYNSGKEKKILWVWICRKFLEMIIYPRRYANHRSRKYDPEGNVIHKKKTH